MFAAGAAAVWIAAGVGYVVLEAVAAAGFRPRYSYANNYISDLGVTSRGIFAGRMIDSPLAYLMNTGFYLQGTLFLVGAVLTVRGLGTKKAGLFLTLAAMNALGNLLVGTVHSGPIAQADGTTWVHATGAFLAIVGGNAAILAGSSIVHDAGGPRWYRAASIGLAVLGLLSFVMLAVDSKTSAVNIVGHGAWERSSVYSIIGWQLLTAAYLLVRGR